MFINLSANLIGLAFILILTYIALHSHSKVKHEVRHQYFWCKPQKDIWKYEIFRNDNNHVTVQTIYWKKHYKANLHRK